MAKEASLPTPVPTKSASLVERIRLKFQKNQQQPVVGMHKSSSMTRSSSLSSITWARLRSKKQVTPHEDDMELPISTNHDDPSRYGHDVEDHRPLDQVQRRYRPQAPKKPQGAYPPPRPSRTTRVRFAQVVSVHETFSQKEYVRGSGPEDVVCTQLTPSMAQYIKEELNQFKLYEMKVHHSSRSHTHFFM
ncbi:hypothetical protein K492DRAFT_32861 [Lichtheimia hyalospora FSU 10163]|nr:hypothetical protein K492DRAFT_32861 [Lichtheimia hyalospora FSU 10163]